MMAIYNNYLIAKTFIVLFLFSLIGLISRSFGCFSVFLIAASDILLSHTLWKPVLKVFMEFVLNVNLQEHNCTGFSENIIGCIIVAVLVLLGCACFLMVRYNICSLFMKHTQRPGREISSYSGAVMQNIIGENKERTKEIYKICNKMFEKTLFQDMKADPEVKWSRHLEKPGLCAYPRTTLVIQPVLDSGSIRRQNARIASFRQLTLHIENLNISPIMLAQDGFYYDQEFKSVVCFRCQNKIPISDNMNDRDCVHSKGCKFYLVVSDNYRQSFQDDQDDMVHQGMARYRQQQRHQTEIEHREMSSTQSQGSAEINLTSDSRDTCTVHIDDEILQRIRVIKNQCQPEIAHQQTAEETLTQEPTEVLPAWVPYTASRDEDTALSIRRRKPQNRQSEIEDHEKPACTVTQESTEGSLPLQASDRDTSSGEDNYS